MIKPVEGRLSELRPTIGGGDMVELLRPSVIKLVFLPSRRSEPVCQYPMLAALRKQPHHHSYLRSLLLHLEASLFKNRTAREVYVLGRGTEIVKALAYYKNFKDLIGDDVKSTEPKVCPIR